MSKVKNNKKKNQNKKPDKNNAGTNGKKERPKGNFRVKTTRRQWGRVQTSLRN